MSYQMYRTTTLGDALQRTLDDFIADDQLPQALAQKVLAVFDRSIAEAITSRAKNKITFKAGKLRSYRYYDNVWMFLMENVEFRDMTMRISQPVETLKIVACDGCPPIIPTPPSRQTLQRRTQEAAKNFKK
ncbi:hypothetical protein L596_030896 [Steinernema carpocapsae]|uniref:Transcription initiation factor IIA subunit 2 n=1 Tax=Steinernema carpocapsae TaxID=34508 RepID=A0A4U5MH89_STECR|nr:hypothetical protein L596_030896 [Steinernema carpocapsae]